MAVMIETTADLEEFLRKEKAAAPSVLCAIDTEADSLHRYKESLCLIQFAAASAPVLIDPLAIEDLSPLGGYLADATVWMHGADYDMTMLKREFGTLPPTVFDTQIGARLLGERKFGLADLVLRYFGVELTKSSQKADWGKRPLSEKMVAYALNDVHYLLEMGEIIVAQLKEKGRHEWFLESCEAARQRVLEREESDESNWRIRGSGRLDRKGLAWLRALWHWRDHEAELWDRPCFMVLSNNQLLEWTNALSSGKPVTLPRHYRSERIKRFKTVVADTSVMKPDAYPEKIITKRRKRDKDFDKRLDALLKKRNDLANEHDIDPSLFAPRATLEAIAANETSPGESLLRWQIACLGLDAQ